MSKYVKLTLKHLLRSNLFTIRQSKLVDKLFDYSKEEIDDYNNNAFMDLFRYAYTNSKFYRDFYIEHGIGIDDIKSINDIEKLPILTKDIVRSNIDKIRIGNRRYMQKVSTSGTTGNALFIYQSYSSVLMEQAYVTTYRRMCGFKVGERLASLRGHLDSKDFRLKIHVANTLFLSSYQINQSRISEYYKELEKFSPKAIEGYPSSIYNLCCILKENSLKLNIPICFTSSETLYDFQRNIIQEVLNCEIFDWYGCTEHTIALGEDINHNGFFEVPGYSYNEFQENCIITTSFINRDFPLIRYKVNDKITLKENYLKSKATDPIVSHIEGRTESFVIAKDNTKYSRMMLFRGISNIKLAQIVQWKVGEIDINVVTYEPLSQKEKQTITNNIEEKFGKGNIDYSINNVKETDIIYTARGKFNMVISKIEK